MHRCALLLALVATLPLTGCVAIAVAGAAGTVGYIQYEKNETYTDFDEDIHVVWTASVDALEALGFEIPYSVARTLTGPVNESEIEGDGYRVRLERYLGDVTRARVRVGTFDTEDNRRRADLILEEISRRVSGR